MARGMGHVELCSYDLSINNDVVWAATWFFAAHLTFL